jgi:hypothetical protein
MTRRRSLLLLLCFASLFLGGVTTTEAFQSLACAKNPDIGPVVDTHALPPVINFDPCTHRFTMLDDALKRTGGPYISQAEAERRAIYAGKPTMVRSWFVSYGQAAKMMNLSGEDPEVYPDREVWLVVVQGRDQGPMPSVPYGIKPWPRRWYFFVLDATTGRNLVGGGNGKDSPDWPASLPE